MLRFLGKVGKGLATLLGAALIGGGGVTAVATGQGEELRQIVAAIVEHGPALVTALGALLAMFGVGRKAGQAAALDG